ncbi:MAG: hypothetical protein D6781_06930 [Verrucomicrobia bacterium]|nr:MAG: hypothetical protein D6781_06930 [Verrucomicrobiota bacterium]
MTAIAMWLSVGSLGIRAVHVDVTTALGPIVDESIGLVLKTMIVLRSLKLANRCLLWAVEQ